MTVFSVLLILFATLKLIGLITWPWLWVLAPLWIGAIVWFVLGVGFVIIGALTVWGR
ncbi:MAG: hypothetical protein AB1698_01580 [Pseudomonadota bacterium]